MPKTNFWRYFPYSLKLKAKPRRGGGNMFRHQVETFAILLEYGYDDPVLLKAALIHDLVEDGEDIGFVAFEEIPEIDEDGAEVLKLVKEVSQHVTKGVKEPKGEFLLRIMSHGSEKAKILKLADRISNLTGLSHAGDQEFVKKYLAETKACILPFAGAVNSALAAELQNRVEILQKMK